MCAWSDKSFCYGCDFTAQNQCFLHLSFPTAPIRTRNDTESTHYRKTSCSILEQTSHNLTLILVRNNTNKGFVIITNKPIWIYANAVSVLFAAAERSFNYYKSPEDITDISVTLRKTFREFKVLSDDRPGEVSIGGTRNILHDN